MSASRSLALCVIASLTGCANESTKVKTFDCGPGAPINIVLGRPTDTSITASVLATPGMEVFYELGTTPGVYASQTAVATSPDGKRIETELTGLSPDTRYYYRLRYRLAGETEYSADRERSFHTQRPAGASFHFGVQGDSHPERQGKMYSPDLYVLNMKNVAAREPDFYFALGDDFSIERLIETDQLSQDHVDQMYLCQRNAFGLIGNSSLYLVNGNHEQAAGYLVGDRFQTPYDDAPVFAGNARVTYFPLPGPGGFYTGDAQEVAGVGLLRDYYAWQWGDALFVTIDPYWHSPVPADTGVPGVGKADDPWEISIGDEQYAWLEKTLESSTARYKFVFSHHVLGGGRGAAGIVHSYEWGGYDRNGDIYEFPAQRPTWAMPIHQLMDANHVTVFFSAHDHVFAREKVDGVIYQSVPNPADDTYTAFNRDAYDPDAIMLPGAVYDPGYGVVMPNAGFLDVEVSPTDVTISYVRAVLPGDEAAAGAANGEVAYSYSVTD